VADESASAESRLTILVQRYRKLVRAVVARAGGRILRDRTDDLEQDVWVAIWRRLQGEQEIEHPTSYVYTVARREAMRAVEEELKRVQLTDELPAPEARPFEAPDRVLEARDSGARVHAALAKLSPDRRRAMQAVLNGLDVAEIQDLFGWSYQRARNLIARGRADLRKQLEAGP